MEKKNERFVMILDEGTTLKKSGNRKILVDTETGVHYLVVQNGYGLGVTPLLDENGKPVIKK